MAFDGLQNSIIKEFLSNDSLSEFDKFLDAKWYENSFSQTDIDNLNKQKAFIIKIKKADWTKNQHYVPQFYLKKFTNSNGKIETLDKENKRLLKEQSPERICSDEYFYAAETWKPDILSQMVEKIFCFYEDKFVKLYDKVYKDILTNKQINNPDLYQLCVFISSSWSRSKYFRDHLSEMNAKIIKDMASMLYRSEKSRASKNPRVQALAKNEKAESAVIEWDYDIHFNNIDHIEFATSEKNIYGFGNLLFNKRINVYIAKWNRNFITSDTCVVEVSRHKEVIYGNTFIDRLHYFVLSPRVLLEFVRDTSKGTKKVKRKLIDNEEVMYFNMIRSMYSKFLYSNTKEDFPEELYTKARINYIERLVDLFPNNNGFAYDKKIIDEYKILSQQESKYFSNNYDMLKYYEVF